MWSPGKPKANRMANQETSSERLASWTIKNMPVEARLEAVALAARAGLAMAQWQVHAIRVMAQLEAAPEPAPVGIVARRAGPIVVPEAAPAMSVPHAAELLRETRAAFQAAGLPMPAKLATAAAALSMTAMREAKLSSQARARAAKPGKTRGPTEMENGQTLSLEHNPEV